MAAVSVFLYILLAVLLVGLIGLGIYALVLYFREEEKTEDDPIVFNFRSNLTQGHILGIERSSIKTLSGRWRCTFDPKDVSPNNILKKNWKRQRIIIPHEHIITLPKGQGSSHKTIKIYLPKREEDIPKAWRETKFGKMVALMTHQANYEKMIYEMLREGTKRRDDVLKDLSTGELSAEWMSTIKGLLIDDLKATILKANKESHQPSTSYNYPRPLSSGA